ncbi:hypothetical protein E2562_022496 [Oryza meyeriana var. granulata]|uniref:Uncharacterized protein n=1 Tax=Oryza meyeriana var. granulata TaxID=110450 RepID=A0A6G1BNC2_9ORYZ|nr:hypothetical protein E2562_022496 [Oryza meyeriana var. granulata]
MPHHDTENPAGHRPSPRSIALAILCSAVPTPVTSPYRMTTVATRTSTPMPCGHAVAQRKSRWPPLLHATQLLPCTSGPNEVVPRMDRHGVNLWGNPRVHRSDAILATFFPPTSRPSATYKGARNPAISSSFPPPKTAAADPPVASFTNEQSAPPAPSISSAA